jgi:hypothetical protein
MEVRIALGIPKRRVARRLSIVIIQLCVLLLPLEAQADAFVACWVTKTIVPGIGIERQITHCRLADGRLVEFADDSEVPVRLYPMMGSVGGSACWYYTSQPNNEWILIQVYPTGDADIARNAGPGEWVPVGLYSRCNSEPDPEHPYRVAWEYVTEYIHPPPTPDLDPLPGFGVTGLETRLTVTVPEPHHAILDDGALVLEVEIEVTEVIVHWGDGTITSYRPDGTSLDTPDGMARHTYERKDAATELAVAYGWNARWRLVGGSWDVLDVPDTITTVGYPVTEIVSVLGS